MDEERGQLADAGEHVGEPVGEHAGDEAQEQERRLEALHALAQQQQQQQQQQQGQEPAGTASRAESAEKRRAASRIARPAGARLRRRLVLAGVGALAVCVVVVGALVWLRPSPKTTVAKPDVVTFALLGTGIVCPQDAVWSPDGTRVALLGYGGRQCDSAVYGMPNNGHSTAVGMLEIRDAATGLVERSLTLDTPVLSATVPSDVRQNAQVMAQVGVTYSSLAWTPDGRRIVLFAHAFRDVAPNGPGQDEVTNYGWALVFVQPGSGEIQVQPVQVPAPSTDTSPPSHFAPVHTAVYDMVADTISDVPVPQALAYAWDASDTLTPTQPMPVSADAPPPAVATGPVGNPNGGQQFTMWQEGYIDYVKKCPPQGPGGPQPPTPTVSPSDVLLLRLSTTTWSPDGRYLMLGPLAYGRLNGVNVVAPTPDPSRPQGGYSCGEGDVGSMAQMPVRDPAMAAAVSLLNPFGEAQVTLAWSLDGRRLAASSADATVDHPLFNIYDCANGNVVWQMPPQKFASLSSPTRQLNFEMRWSPDSHHLLLLDQQGHDIYILGPKTVGA